MTWDSEIAAWQRKKDRILTDVAVDCTVEVQRSVVEGSELTGAPGQPVDIGTLKGSFIPSFLVRSGTRVVWRTVTNLVYAPFIEAGNYVQRSAVGGPHSVAKTRTGWVRIVDSVARRHAR